MSGTSEATIILLILLVSTQSSLAKKKEEKCKELTCYVCTGDFQSDCPKDQKKNQTPVSEPCDHTGALIYNSTVPMCGIQRLSSGIVRRGCFPGTGETTCFENPYGFQCLCDDCGCNAGEVVENPL